LRQPHRNREAEAENGRQSRMPVWVEVGRIILARGSHAAVGRQVSQKACRQEEAVVGRLRGRQGIIQRHGGRGRN
jgi:hypothetical protein